MTPRQRFTLIFAVTVLAISAVLGYMVGRARHWHDRGWVGVVYLSGMAAQSQGKLMGLSAGHVMLTASGSPADGKLHYRDEILSINGIPPHDMKRIMELDGKVDRGSLVVYRVRRGQQIVDVPLRLDTPLRSRYIVTRYIVAVVVAFAFIGIALVIIARAPPGDSRATIFYALALLSAITMIGGMASIVEQSNARGIDANSLPFKPSTVVFGTVTFLYPPLILHLALVFPRRRPILERRPKLLQWMYAAAAAAIIVGLLSSLVVLNVEWQDAKRTAQEMEARFEPIRLGLIALSVVLVLWIIVAARREGLRRALMNRPFHGAFIIPGICYGLAALAEQQGWRIASGILGTAAIGIPMLAVISFLFFALAAFYRSYRSANVEEKRQVTWPLFGLTLSLGTKIICGALALGCTIWITFAHHDMIRWRGFFEVLQIVPTIFTLAVPLSFAVAIFKYRLMNIDLIIRKTVVYAILSTAIIALYLVLVGGLGTLLVQVAGLQNQTMVIASTLVVALLFVPLRNKLQTLVDRNLFRHRYDYAAALKAIASETVSASELATFLGSAAEKMQQALQNRAVVIFVPRNEDLVAAAKVGIADSLLGTLRMKAAAFTPLLDRPFDPRRHNLPDDATAAMKRIEAVLVVPINTPGTAANGCIALAAKLSAQPFDVEDIDFVRSVADQLDIGIDRIRQQREEADFEQARAIQQSLLPREMPNVAGLDVSGTWQPARLMGGDYFDLLKLSETELAVCIGDVAGKGMSAALLMSGLQAAVRASASNSPRDLCERVRRVVVSTLTGGRFVTFFYATLDTAAMKLRWCNAGHNAPVLARADGTTMRLAEGGPAFSRLFRGDAYSEREVDLAPGDRLVLFIDGVSEAIGADGNLFGEPRIEQLVAEHRARDARDLEQVLVDASTQFTGGELEDDLTLVVVAVTSS